jgi:hypothetical protein
VAQNIEKDSERGKNNSQRLAREFVFLLTKPEFYSHLVSDYPHPWLQVYLGVDIALI